MNGFGLFFVSCIATCAFSIAAWHLQEPVEPDDLPRLKLVCDEQHPAVSLHSQLMSLVAEEDAKALQVLFRRRMPSEPTLHVLGENGWARDYRGSDGIGNWLRDWARPQLLMSENGRRMTPRVISSEVIGTRESFYMVTLRVECTEDAPLDPRDAEHRSYRVTSLVIPRQHPPGDPGSVHGAASDEGAGLTILYMHMSPARLDP